MARTPLYVNSVRTNIKEREEMSFYMNQALAFERMQRYQAEAAEYRRIKAVRSQEPRVIERMIQSINRGLLSISESLKVDRRPRIPTV
jgi:hypothetical protein